MEIVRDCIHVRLFGSIWGEIVIVGSRYVWYCDQSMIAGDMESEVVGDTVG